MQDPPQKKILRQSYDYGSAHVLIPFIEEFCSVDSIYDSVHVFFGSDGAMRFKLQQGVEEVSLVWSETECADAYSIKISSGFVSVTDTADAWALNAMNCCRHVAGRIGRLLRGNPPFLLQWRNRNPQKIYWGTHLFERLCPGLLVRGKTRYWDYVLCGINEYEGLINLEFESRQASVTLRLTLTEELETTPIASWGPISLVLLEDQRTDKDRCMREHRIEDFAGYILSRNLPVNFTLAFERRDPPLGYMPPDFNVDLLNMETIDDTNWFKMIHAANKDLIVVNSCDRECLNLFSYISRSTETACTSAPWVNPPSNRHFDNMYLVHPDDVTTVMGNNKPEQCLTELAVENEKNKLIIYIDSCLSRFVGEDMDGTIRDFRKKSDIPIIPYEIDLSQEPYLGKVTLFWKRVAEQLVEENVEPEQNTVFFLGMDSELIREMSLYLSKNGINVIGSLFPGIVPSEIRQMNQAALLVANSWEYIDVSFSGMLDMVNRPLLSIPLPYGVKGTVDWLKNITQHTLGEDLDEYYYERIRNEFSQEKKKIKGQRVGLFLRYQDAASVLSPEKRFGIPLVNFLRELGFGLDVNLFVESQEETKLGEVADALSLNEGQGDSLSVFEHSSELCGLIHRGSFNLVYTETFRDERIVSAGKVPFSSNQLQPGFSGAVLTAKMLGTMANTTFYTRNHKFLAMPSHYNSWQKGV